MAGYESYAERFATWGYVTLRWNPHEGALGGVTQATRGRMAAELINWVIAESKDTTSVLYGKIDTTKGVVQAGHSLGGKTALLAAVHNPSVVGYVLMDPVGKNPSDSSFSPSQNFTFQYQFQII